MSGAEVKEDSVMSTEAMIGLCVVIIIILFIYGVYASLRIEREKEEQKKKLKEEISEILNGHSFDVVIRKRDGRRTDFESRFIGALADCGAKVYALKDDDVKSVLKGELGIVSEGEKMIVGTVIISTTYGHNSFDCRLIEKGGNILFAGSRSNWFDPETSEVIMDVIHKIALVLEND